MQLRPSTISKEERRCRGIKKQKKGPCIKDSIPDDVIENILLYLPAKSLLRFKCLSKSWNDTIGSSFFTRAHLQNNKAHTTLVAVNKGTLSVLGLSKVASGCVTLKENLKIQFERESRVRIEASCDGILCIKMCSSAFTHRINNKIVLWNPNITKHKIIDSPGALLGLEALAIGFDPSIDAYKIIKFSKEIIPRSAYDNKVEVFTVKSDHWRPVSYDLSYSPEFQTRPVSLKGVVYWHARNPINDVIVCFDLGNEVFSVKFPPTGRRRMCGLMEVEGKLGCFCETPNTFSSRFFYVDIWVMEEESWVKLYSMPYKYNFVCDLMKLSYVGEREVIEVWSKFGGQENYRRHGYDPSYIGCASSLISFD